MLITGTLYYNDDGFRYEKAIEGFDTSKKADAVNQDMADAIAFALYGKTVFEDIVREGKPVPLIDLNIDCGGKKTRVVRQPRYVQEQSFGGGRPSPEQFNIQADTPKLQTVQADEFFKRVKECIDMSFDEFAAYCKG